MSTKKNAVVKKEEAEDDLPKKEVKSTLPDWYLKDVVGSFRAGVARVFIVHGDIDGLTKNPGDNKWLYGRLEDFLWSVTSQRKLVFVYDIADGFRFLSEAAEKEFRRLAELDAETAAGSDPVAAAKADLKKKRPIPSAPEAALPLIEKVLQRKDKVAVIIKAAHLLAPSSVGGGALQISERVNVQRMKNWGSDRRIKSQGNVVFLITGQLANMSAELRQSGGFIRSIFISKPSYEERFQYLEAMLEGEGDFKDIKLADGVNLKNIAVATQGMHLGQILSVLRLAYQSKEPINLEALKREKIKMLNDEYGDVMEVVEPERGLEDIGGLAHIKAYLNEVLAAIKSGEAALVPMGILLMGPPGTGKTAIVEALAKEAGFNFVKIKNLRSMWVGESEAKAERMMRGLRELSPVVVMNDEADLAEAQRDAPKGDSGVSERLMKMWMEFLSDPRIRGKVIVISCTNRPDRIDAALKRSGRNDERILLPMPTILERKEIFKVMFKRYKLKNDIADFSEFAALTHGRSGADIEKIVLDANRFRSKDGKKKVDEEALRLAIADAILSSNQADIDRMTILGVLESSSRRLLPTSVSEMIAEIVKRNLVPELDEIVKQIKERKIANIEIANAALDQPVSKAPKVSNN